MEDLLIKNLVKSFESETTFDSRKKNNAPFITISREFGCQANELARHIIAGILQRGHHWSMVNKEVLSASAADLQIHPDKLSSILNDSNRGMFDEIIEAASSKYYKSDRKIRYTIARIVTSFALKGDTIIIGRASAAITQGMKNGLHIRLTAPQKWRLESVMERLSMNRETAMKQITAIDHKRFKFQRDYMKASASTEDIYDITFNCSTVSHLEMARMVLQLMEERKMI